ncbi:MAG: tetratricopeptide repeat protein [Deltaproteobacteria bacterium]
MRYLPLTILFISLTFFSCKNSNKNITPEIKNLEKNILDKKQTGLIDELNNKYLSILQDTNVSANDKKIVTEHALDFFTKINNSSISSYYLYELMKKYELSDHKERTKQFIKLIDENGNKELSKTMKVLYANKYPDDKKYLNTLGDDLKTQKIDFDLYLKSLAEKMYINLGKTGVFDPMDGKNYINSCEVYALINPESNLTPEYLYLGAQVAQNIKMFLKTIELYDWILAKYPGYEKYKTVLFMKGFIQDNELKQFDEAKKTYQQFLQKFPDSELADDVKSALELLGKSDAEILKILENKNKG